MAMVMVTGILSCRRSRCQCLYLLRHLSFRRYYSDLVRVAAAMVMAMMAKVKVMMAKVKVMVKAMMAVGEPLGLVGGLDLGSARGLNSCP